MKSFRFYIVSILFVGIAVGCADEHRAFKPKATLGALGASVARKPVNETEAEKKARLEAEAAQAKKDKQEQDRKEAEQKKKDVEAAETARKKAADDAAAAEAAKAPGTQPLTTFTNLNGGGTNGTLKSNGNTPVPSAAAAAAQAQAISKPTPVQVNEELAYLSDAEGRKKAVETILGVTTYSAIKTEENRIPVEVLSLIQIGDRKETIVFSGNVALGMPNESGLTSNLVGRISTVDKEEVLDAKDGIYATAWCSLDQNKDKAIHDAVHCQYIMVRIGVKVTVKKDGKDETVSAYASYQFREPAVKESSKYKAGFAQMDLYATSIDKLQFKYYEAALGWSEMPKLPEDEKPAPAAVIKPADNVREPVDEPITSYQEDAAKGSEGEKTEGHSEPAKDPFEAQMPVDEPMTSYTPEDKYPGDENKDIRVADRIETEQARYAEKRAAESRDIRVAETIENAQAGYAKTKAEAPKDFTWGRLGNNVLNGITFGIFGEKQAIKYPWED